MQTMTSKWEIGTYDLLVQSDHLDGVMVVTVFARPVDLADEASDRDAPILAQLEATFDELELAPDVKPAWLDAFTEVGEWGMVPEVFEARFGPLVGLRALLALFQAADRDFRGVDLEERPWREPSMQAFPIMQRTSDVMIILRSKLEMSEG